MHFLAQRKGHVPANSEKCGADCTGCRREKGKKKEFALVGMFGRPQIGHGVTGCTSFGEKNKPAIWLAASG